MKKTAKERLINFKVVSIIICFAIILLILAIVLVNHNNKNKSETEQVDIDGFEISSEARGYIMLDETVIDYDKEKTIIPVSDELKRVSKNSIVAVYKSDDYESKIDRLYEIDNEINLKLSKLPYVYSKEVSRIENSIDEFVKSNKGDKSYVEMLNFKNTLDELTYKKALAKSKLSPSGNAIIELLNERDKYLGQIRENSKNTIKTDVSGVAYYKVDGLEHKFDSKTYNNFTSEKVDKLISSFDDKNNSSFGIKIINNYEAYIVFKFNNSANDDYAVLNRYYTLNIVNQRKNIDGLLVSKFNSNNMNYYVFKINNNIEDFLEFRKLDFKIVWKSLDGFAIKKENLKYKKVGDEMLSYVKVLSMNESIDVFVKKIIELDEYYVVQNYTNIEREKYGIEKERKLLRYDRLVRFRKER